MAAPNDLFNSTYRVNACVDQNVLDANCPKDGKVINKDEKDSIYSFTVKAYCVDFYQPRKEREISYYNSFLSDKDCIERNGAEVEVGESCSIKKDDKSLQEGKCILR